MSNRPGLPTIVPIPGAGAPGRVEENAKLIDLTENELEDILKLIKDFEVAGTRYPDGAPVNT